VLLKPGFRYAFVHALIDVGGRFTRLREVGDSALVDPAGVLEALARWQFRPATRDGQPAPVEALLCLPPHTN
jgi:hypothetical protein